MSQYNEKAATHYAAYRPPLHSIILKKALSETDTFQKGLDIGCGTGYSTLALAKYCSNVVGIDPSQSMLHRVTNHQKIRYKIGSAEDLPLPDETVDIITFAGSLFYTDLEKAAPEIQRVCKKEATIVVYDFEMLLEDVLEQLGIHLQKTGSDYDHSINFSEQPGFEEIVAGKEQVNLEFIGSQLAHVLLSDHQLYDTFSDQYSTGSPFEKLKNMLVKEGNHFFIKADIYYSAYRISDET